MFLKTVIPLSTEKCTNTYTENVMFHFKEFRKFFHVLVPKNPLV